MLISPRYKVVQRLRPISGNVDKEFRIQRLCQLVVGVNPSEMGIGPVPVIKKLLEKNALTQEQVDLFEINEAFAAQAIACIKALNLEPQKVNVWGGATALGHPLGATGLKITLTLARALKHYKKGYGISSACIGGGQGIGVLLKSI
jgi:acetyl-CoA C-acetyltransferase/acetyl-CoA acyltransferase 2